MAMLFRLRGQPGSFLHDYHRILLDLALCFFISTFDFRSHHFFIRLLSLFVVAGNQEIFVNKRCICRDTLRLLSRKLKVLEPLFSSVQVCEEMIELCTGDLWCRINIVGSEFANSLREFLRL